METKMSKIVKYGQLYRYYKNNNVYIIVGLAVNKSSNKDEIMVVYKALNSYDLFVRDINNFLGTAVLNSEVVPRFKLISFVKNDKICR